MMPGLETYRRMLAGLTAAFKDFDAAGDAKERNASSDKALQAVIVFLVADPEVRDGHLVRPLTFIQNALQDVRQGANVAALTHAPEGPVPTDTSHEMVQTALAWQLELMIGVKIGTEKSARCLAALAKRADLTDEDGEDIPWKRIVQWRKDIRANRAPPAVMQGWASWRDYKDARLLKLPYSVEKHQFVEKNVEARIRALADLFPLATRRMRRQS